MVVRLEPVAPLTLEPQVLRTRQDRPMCSLAALGAPLERLQRLQLVLLPMAAAAAVDLLVVAVELTSIL